MRYLRAFYPSKYDGYFKQREIERIEFAPVTIFCGGNFSGKSTILNAIADGLDYMYTDVYDPCECLTHGYDYYEENVIMESDEDDNPIFPDSAIIQRNVNMFSDYEFLDNAASDSEWVLLNMCDFSEYDICFLDCPETALSIEQQRDLVERIEQCAYLDRTQFVISTSSPIIASVKEALIYDLDVTPVKAKEWHDVNVIRQYYKFFCEKKK